MIKIDEKHLAYLEQELQAEKIAFGTPVYKSINACLLASVIGYKENFRSAYKKKDDSYLFFASGKLLFHSS